MQPIVIADVTVSFEEFKHINQQLAGRRQLLVRLLLLAVMTYFYWFSEAAPSPTSPYALALFAVLLLGTLAIMTYGGRRGIRQAYARSQSYLAPATYTLHAGGIDVTSAAVRGTVQWAAIRQARVVDGWWHLATDGGGGFLLAATRVQPPATPADVDALLRQRGLLA